MTWKGWLSLPVAVAILGGLVGWWRWGSSEVVAAKTVRRFAGALAERDLAAARSLAGPRLRAELGSRAESLRSAAPVRIAGVSVRVEAVSRDWARAAAVIETEGKEWDVLWYDLDVTRVADGWRISDVRPVLPRVDGSGGRAPEDFDPSPLARYLDAVQAGEWDEAGKHLAGPALAAQRAGQGVLGPKGAGLIREHSPPEVVPLWARGKTVVARARYRADGRDVSLLTTFYRTGGGWRVVDVRQE